MQVYSFFCLAEQPMAVQMVTSPLWLCLSTLNTPLIPLTVFVQRSSPFWLLGSPAGPAAQAWWSCRLDWTLPLPRPRSPPHVLSWLLCRCLAAFCLFGRKVVCKERDLKTSYLHTDRVANSLSLHTWLSYCLRDASAPLRDPLLVGLCGQVFGHTRWAPSQMQKQLSESPFS